MHFWQSLKKFCTFRATLNFRKFKVALNPMYRIFLNLPKAASYPAYQISITRKNFTLLFLRYKGLKQKLREFKQVIVLLW